MGKKLVQCFKNFDLTNQAFNSLFNSTAWTDEVGWIEKDNQYFLSLDLPMMDKERICLELSCQYLTVSAERKTKDETGESVESYTNIFSLPPDLDESTIEAKYENNVLVVSGNKKLETVNSKKIEVK